MPANPHVIHWIENELIHKLRDSEFMQHRLAVLKVGFDQGDSPEEVLRRVIADAVTDAAGMKLEGGHDQQQNRN